MDISLLKNRIWTLAGLAAVLGIVTGFAVPLAASYGTSPKFYSPTRAQLPKSAVLVIPTLEPPAVVVTEDKDSELEKLAARNRRLEALVVTLRKKAEAPVERPND